VSQRAPARETYLERVISGKSPRLLRILPGFVLRYLKRIIHQDRINATLGRLQGTQGLEFIDEVLKDFGVRIMVEGLANIPPTGRGLIVANHPLGGLDGLALMKVVGSVRKDIVFPVNDLLMHIPNLRGLFIPINKHGSNASNVKVFDDTFASDKLVLYFPAGLCSRKQHGRILDLEWKKGIVTRARRYERDVIPVHISGRNSNFFYNLANFRTAVGLRTNVEMLYLVDEMVKQKDQEVRITFGRPIPYDIFDRSRKDADWAGRLKAHTYRLEREPGALFDPNLPNP
ncbi:MAG TPA: 1-acyl-sn-glycerol-3-phosphate acyltransferase, partial [Bacteroidales bacterium]|nr:1-acyl-sn-glycerol-3-phosphate acyltransferase [Bacteroidales bacterium]